MYPPSDTETIKENLRYIAKQLGFSLFGVAPLIPPTHGEHFKTWIEDGMGAEMQWLTRDPTKRLNPELILPGGKSIIVLGTSYASLPEHTLTPYLVSRYARGLDYHDLIDSKLKDLDATLQEYGGIQKYYTDTGPILERDFATTAGLGWCGKSNLLIHPHLGSSTFLSVILTTLDLPPDSAQPSRCGFCSRCLDACPTGALKGPHRLDARDCLAYLTIEHPGPIPEKFRKVMGSHLYGCDICLDACPWNRKAPPLRDLRYALNQALFHTPLREFLSWTEDDFTRAFKGSPIKRIKLPKFLRNVCVVLGNTGTPEDSPALLPLVKSENPLIAEHADWALQEIRLRHPDA